MKELTEKEMKQISGGGISFGTGALIVLGAVFVIGVIDGYIPQTYT